MATQISDSTKQRPRATVADELAVIVQRAQAFTNASGAAIAISEGNADEIICRARSGASAPDIGASLRVEGSFTGICIQTGKELRCDDAETDTRVDTAAIRSLGIRSMVVTPIKEENKAVGVLAVFAPTPHAFTITHVAVLKTMADQITGLLARERRAASQEQPTEPIPISKPVASAPPLPPPVVIKPSGSSAAAVAPARVVTSTAPKIEPLKAVPVAEVITPAVPFPKREERREPKPEPVNKPATGTFEPATEDSHKGGSGKFILIGVVAVVLIAAGGLWMWKSRGTAAAAPAPVASAPAPSAQPQPPANNTPGASNPAATSAAPAAGTPVETATAASPRNAAPEKKTEPRNSSASSRPEPPPTPAAVSIASGPSKIGNVKTQDQGGDVAAPSLSVGGSSSTLSSLARPDGNTVAPGAITRSELVQAQVLHRVDAVYPAIAKARRITGTVVVQVTVGKDGHVNNPKMVSGPVVFRDAAFDAVKQWTYKPATLNGQPIEQPTEIKLTFRPG